MNLFEVSEDYIAYLHKIDHRVLLNHKNVSDRKYVGVVLQVSENDYFVPLSSPDKADYIPGTDTVRRSIVPIHRIILKNGDKIEFLGKLLFSNMIPIPPQELKEYVIKDEKNPMYRNLILKQWKYIQKN